MEAITGNFSPFSYLEASILKRELKEFGALLARVRLGHI
jgi:hypothetical protein